MYFTQGRQSVDVRTRSSSPLRSASLAFLLVVSTTLTVGNMLPAGAIEETSSPNSSTAQPAEDRLKTIQGSEQNPPKSQQAETWRKKSPSLPPPRPFVMPKVECYKLSNGLDVQLVEDHRVPFVTAELGFKSGSASEPRDLLGLASLSADMMTEGTQTKKSKEIADEVDFIGGALSAGSDVDNTLVSSSALSKYSDRLLKILSDVVLKPSFPEDELQLKKTNLIEELVIKRSEPSFLLDERFSKVTFGDHPYSVIAPTKETVQKITREDLVKFHDQHYVPNQAHLVVIGDFDSSKMKQLISASFENNWKPGTPPSLPQAEVPTQHGRKIYLVDRPGSVQSSIKLGNVAINKTDPDYFPMIVGNQILGGAGNARLFLNIRENKGYTYGAYSSVGARKQRGAFEAEAEVRTDVTAPSLEEFFYELDRIRNVKVSAKELSDAKSYLAGSFQLGLESQTGLASRLLERRLYDLPDNYLETYVGKILAVNPDDIRRVARKHIDLDNIIICVVGDAKKIKPDLDFFAAVEVYDTSGKLSTSGKASALPGS
jgi:predicted Zn-dependent peptidase